MYFYPMYIDQPLIETIAASSRILPYIDLPLQHINDQLLRRMARRVTRAETDFAAGAAAPRHPRPGPPHHVHHRLPGRDRRKRSTNSAISFKQQRFERLGVFTYSYEDNTPSAALDGHLPQEVRDSASRPADGDSTGDRRRTPAVAGRPTPPGPHRSAGPRTRNTPGSAGRRPMRRTWTASFS